MKELKIEIEIQNQKRQNLECRIQDEFAYERFPSHAAFVVMTESFQKLKTINAVIEALEETLAAFLSNIEDVDV